MEHKQIQARIYHYAATELTIAEIPAFEAEDNVTELQMGIVARKIP